MNHWLKFKKFDIQRSRCRTEVEAINLEKSLRTLEGNVMNSLEEFETKTYPQLWYIAFNLGIQAKKEGYPKVCNLQDSRFITPSGKILKVYESAWKQGWDNI